MDAMDRPVLDEAVDEAKPTQLTPWLSPVAACPGPSRPVEKILSLCVVA